MIVLCPGNSCFGKQWKISVREMVMGRNAFILTSLKWLLTEDFTFPTRDGDHFIKSLTRFSSIFCFLQGSVCRFSLKTGSCWQCIPIELKVSHRYDPLICENT
jgi:hypothetical protein